MKNVFLLVIFCLFTFISYAGFHCPENITINCDMDIHNTDMTGYPNTTGFNVGHPIAYSDIYATDGCGVGTVNRTWYQDLNGDQMIGDEEPSCMQIITVGYLENGLFDINWPQNKDLTCISDIIFEAPEIVHGPCDLVGFVYEDQVFELTNDACYKILRTFRVINWCLYDENNPASGGIYNYTQVIKVTEKELPSFTECKDITIAMDEGCQANVTISSTALDQGDCPSKELYWTVEVDLGWDLDIDYEYSYLLDDDQYLAPTANGEALSITLPDLVDGGMHGATYTVKDGCGNVRSCVQKILVEDQKAPTPYCHTFITAAFDADIMPAMVHADLFNIGATDNCTESDDIRISFSSDPTDTIKVIECGSQGFQFFNIFAFDEAGNADFCEVFMLIFDNDGCSFRYAPKGTIQNVQGDALNDVNVYLTDGDDVMYSAISADLGDFQFDQAELMSKYYLMTDVNQEALIEPTILDLKTIQNYLLGISEFESIYQNIAADINRDRSLNPLDAVVLRDHLIGKKRLDNKSFSIYVESESLQNTWKDYKSEISYMDYDGSFDLVHISLNELRLADNVSQHDMLIEQKLNDGHTTINLFNENTILIEGMEVMIQLPVGLTNDQIEVSSHAISIIENDYFYNVQTGELKLVVMKDLEIGSEEEWISVTIKSEMDLLANVDINWINQNELVKANVISNMVLDFDEEIVLEKSLLISNVIHSQIQLNNNIELGALEIYDINGLLVYSALNNDNRIDAGSLTPGMYILHWSNGMESKVAKFVKQ